MNENKVELIMLIATKLSDESCAMILQRIKEHHLITVMANEADWNEDLHPRSDDGKFAEKGAGTSIQTPLSERLADLQRRFPSLFKKGELERIAEHEKRIGSETPKSVLKKFEKKLEKAGEKKFSVDDDMIRTLGEGQKSEEYWKLVREQAEAIREEKSRKRDELLSKLEQKKKSKQKALVKQYRDNEDEMDRIEEMYGDRDKGTGFNWPETQEGDEARKRYRHLERQQKTLDKRIDWQSYEDEEPSDL